jgi:hypothetical protein
MALSAVIRRITIQPITYPKNKLNPQQGTKTEKSLD